MTKVQLPIGPTIKVQNSSDEGRTSTPNESAAWALLIWPVMARIAERITSM